MLYVPDGKQKHSMNESLPKRSWAVIMRTGSPVCCACNVEVVAGLKLKELAPPVHDPAGVQEASGFHASRPLKKPN